MAERTKRTKGVKANQSALFRWLMVRHDDIASRMAQPDWPSLCDELRQEGVTNPDRSPVTPIYVRQTWWKVCRLKDKLVEKAAAIEAADPAEAKAAKAAEAARRRKELNVPRATWSWGIVDLGGAVPKEAAPTLPAAMVRAAPAAPTPRAVVGAADPEWAAFVRASTPASSLQFIAEDDNEDVMEVLGLPPTHSGAG